MFSTLILLGAVPVVGAMAVRLRTEPGTVNPFIAPETADPSAETVAVQSELVQTTAPANKGWQTKTLASLRQVEDFLDSLEAHGVKDREVFAIGTELFAIRWR